MTVLLYIVSLASNWFIFEKMGRQGWEGLIPFYNSYVMFQELYGNGWRFLLILVPFYGIYVVCKFFIDLAHAFNKTTGFGWGLILLNPVFQCILAFDNTAQYYGGRNVDAMGTIVGRFHSNSASDADALLKYKELLDEGAITQEEFDRKKDEILNR